LLLGLSFDTRAQSSQLRFRSEKIKIEKINKVKVQGRNFKGIQSEVKKIFSKQMGRRI
jgi:hypothetical protein